jgi:hypothetical protein
VIARGFVVLGTRVVVLKPREPEHKSIIERAHDYLERSFLPGRTFSGPGDFNHQLQEWLQLVNGRTRRVLGCASTDRIGADRQAMLVLPPMPPEVGWRGTTRLAPGSLRMTGLQRLLGASRGDQPTRRSRRQSRPRASVLRRLSNSGR